MARIMAFDYGTKRIGIAVTDPLQIIATPLDTIHPLKVMDFLKKYLESEQVECFVVGLPLQMDGTPSESGGHVKGFIRSLKKQFPEIRVETLDERFTSKMASAAIAQSGLKKSDRREKGRVDTVSAAILLQLFLQAKG